MAGITVARRGVTTGHGSGDLPHSVDSISSLAVRNTVYVNAAGSDTNTGLVWSQAKATIAAAFTALGGNAGIIEVGLGTFPVSGLSLSYPGVEIVGRNMYATILQLQANGTGITESSTNCALRNLTLSLGSSVTAGTGLVVTGFNNRHTNFRVTGQSTGGVGSFTGQTGIDFQGTSGDNTFDGFQIANLGVGVQAESAINYFAHGTFANNVIGTQGGDNTGVAFTAGLAFKDVTWNGAGTTYINLNGTSNAWDFDGIWLDGGATNGMIVGTGTFGPTKLRIVANQLAAQVNCLTINACRQPMLEHIRFGKPGGFTPTELTINGTNCPDGWAGVLQSATGTFEPFAAVIPTSWFYISRQSNFRVDQFSVVYGNAFSSSNWVRANVFQGIKSALAYSASITPDAAVATWQTITVTNATAFTINAPANPPDGSHFQELTVEVLNSSGGAMGVITWNAAFVFPTGAWANPANTKKRFARFEWNGTNWICTGLATADY